MRRCQLSSAAALALHLHPEYRSMCPLPANLSTSTGGFRQKSVVGEVFVCAPVTLSRYAQEIIPRLDDENWTVCGGDSCSGVRSCCGGGTDVSFIRGQIASKWSAEVYNLKCSYNEDNVVTLSRMNKPALQ